MITTLIVLMVLDAQHIDQNALKQNKILTNNLTAPNVDDSVVQKYCAQ